MKLKLMAACALAVIACAAPASAQPKPTPAEAKAFVENAEAQLDKANASTSIVLQNVRVLAIDQIADERLEKPAVVKAVTLEVDAAGGQKLSLAAVVGSLSLMLRKEIGRAHV